MRSKTPRTKWVCSVLDGPYPAGASSKPKPSLESEDDVAQHTAVIHARHPARARQERAQPRRLLGRKQDGDVRPISPPPPGSCLPRRSKSLTGIDPNKAVAVHAQIHQEPGANFGVTLRTVVPLLICRSPITRRTSLQYSERLPSLHPFATASKGLPRPRGDGPKFQVVVAHRRASRTATASLRPRQIARRPTDTAPLAASLRARGACCREAQHEVRSRRDERGPSWARRKRMCGTSR